MSLSEKITRKNNLESNDGLSSFMNMACQQSHDVYEVFYEFIKKTKPSRILEIGTALGGFTDFLKWCSTELNYDISILTYDIIEYNWYNDLRNKSIDIRVENVFNSNYTEVKQDVVDFIRKDGTTIVLCDGGYKIGEFNLLSNFIKEGDFILAHDYSENKDVFETEINRKKWNWFEISYEDIKQSCLDNNLVSYDDEIFKNVVWVCKIKK